MRTVAFLSVLALSTFTATAQQSPFDTPSMDDFQNMQRKMSLLEKKLNALEKKLKKLETKKKSTSSSRSFSSNKGDVEALEKIKLKDEPSEQDVKSYIAKIASASEGQNSYSPDDTQVRLLKKIPSKYVHVLLSHTGHKLNFHIGYAIPDLVDESHKDIVIKNLVKHKELVSSVIRYGWVEDAWSALLIGLRSENHLSHEWLSLVARKNKEDGNKALLEHVTRSVSNDTLQMMLTTKIPRKDIKKAVLKNWEIKQYGHQWEMNSSALCAVQFGSESALHKVADLVASTDQRYSYYKRQAWPVFAQVLDYEGDAMEWYKKNKDQLSYDDVKKKFVIKS